MNRREAIRLGSCGAAVAAAWWAGLPARTWAALPPVPGWSDEDERLLTVVGDTILPETAGSPGAAAVGIGRFVLRMTAECHGPAEAVAVKRFLADLDKAVRAEHGRTFAELPAPAREALLVSFEQRTAAETPSGAVNPFRHVKQLTLLGYFTSEPGATRALRYDPVPGTYRGSVPLAPDDRSWAQ